MAYTSSTFTTTNANVKYRLYVTLISQDIINNTSKINVKLQAWRTNDYETYGTGSANIKLDTVTKTAQAITSSQKITLNSYTVLYNADHIIQHNADGKKTVNLGGYFTINSPVSSNPTWQYFNVALPDIPRASSVTALNADIEAGTTITINKYVQSFTHTLKYAFGTLTGTLVEKTDQSSWGWTIPSSFYAEIPNVSSGTVTITCETYNGDTLIGTTTTTFTATVNQTTNKPDISAVIADSNTVTKALTTNDDDMVKFYSNAEFTITATPKNNAIIVSTLITCGAKTSALLTGTLNAVESGTFIVTATDSRGLTNSITYNKGFIDYVRLTNNPELLRTDPITDNDVNLEYSDNYFNGTFGDVANTLEYKYRYRETGGTWSAYTTLTPTIAGNAYSGDVILAETFDYEKEYEFEVVATDKLSTITRTRIVKKGTPAFAAYSNLFVHNTPVEINGTLTADATEVTSLTVNGDSLKKEVLAESCYIPVDFNYFQPNGTTALTTSYPQLIPIYKASGGLSINSNIITLQGGYMYDFTLSFLGSGNGSTYLSVVDAVANTSVAFGSSVNSISSSTSTAAQANSIQEGRIDLTASGDKTIKVVNTYLAGAFSIATQYGTLKITKYKKITI